MHQNNMDILIKKTDQSGYTLLFAVLTASLVLGVAAFILGVARKQYILSSTAKDSLYSFYAADSGIECIDKNASDITIGTSSANVFCAGQPLSVVYLGHETGYNNPNNNQTFSDTTHWFVWGSNHIKIGFSTSASYDSNNLWGCADVIIDQVADRTKAGVPLAYTVITSRGYNLCDPATLLPDPGPRTVERALQKIVM